ncbi:CaiB/BaiF CoA transferase family protein [Corynebacterium terpenotabidum]|uniref:Carnitine dehydratase n=1 Tax=Corynebacterium terpenotabidum Y-11 TaxID=1200352 RepID=S4XCS2_9CORY|nr:CoA transferase [Corynebacterium terpenotabidum]AGP30386.1 hypothetical protein A606_03675 [Corynebacterium terpenotabidum Y-11]
MTHSATGALDGIIVADFSRVLAGPYATMMLADMGAEVIKVERPGSGDDTRHWGPPYGPDGQATYFAGVNRNKRSLAVDLQTPEGLEQARDLASRADILVHNFRPRVMERLGLGYATVSADNPGIIYASLSGFGTSEEAAELGGYDLVVQAVGGMMSVTGPDADHPVKVGVAVIDVLTGLHLGMGILAALHHRDRTGRGQQVETDLMSCSLASLVNQSAAYAGAGLVTGPMGNRHPSIAPYEVFPTAAGDLAVAAGNDSLYRRLCAVLEIPKMVDDPRFATNPQRVAHRDELVPVIRERLATRTADEWFGLLREAGVPAGPVNDMADAFSFAESLGLDPVVDIAGSRSVRNPLTLSATPVSYRSPAPRLPDSPARITR